MALNFKVFGCIAAKYYAWHKSKVFHNDYDFVELEEMGTDKEKCEQELFEFAERLGLDRFVRRSYLEMMVGGEQAGFKLAPVASFEAINLGNIAFGLSDDAFGL